MTSSVSLFESDKQKLSPKLSPKKIKKKLDKYKKKLTENTKDETDRPAWSTGFAYYMIFVIAIVDITLFVDFYVSNPKVLIGVHIGRILLLMSVICMALASFIIGWRETPVSLGFDIFTKSITFIISIVYTIIVGIKFHNTSTIDRTKSQYFKLISSVLLSAFSLFFLMWAIVDICRSDNPLEATTTVGVFFMIFVSLPGIAISIFSIRGAIEPKSTTTAIPIPTGALRV